MEKLVAVVGSITTATRLEKLLRQKYGFSVNVVHAPTALSGKGCSYSIITERKNLSYIKETARENKINIRGYFLQTSYEGEKKYYALS